MALTIAVAGKGGTGKTTVAALSIRYITEVIRKSVSAIDADPNASLGMALGVTVEKTIADLRDDVIERRMGIPPGMSKEAYIEYCIEECIIENEKYDLLTMGRPEGPKCYCYVNNLLRKYMDRVGNSYPYVVIDNEAGMEHLSRRTTNNVDLLLLVCEPTIIGVVSAQRIIKLASELPIIVKEKAIILNRVTKDGLSPAIQNKLDEFGMDVSLSIAYDHEIYDAASNGKSLLKIHEQNETFNAIGNLLRNYINVEVMSK
ncbi:MAG TPA: nucleotide-binding protein [Candidatus Brocadiia bacterium]|nr:AAA family ATPase [Planctomycetota bacterium]MBI4008563.1 AAA family ATPase [Planctomycetota bacterium]MDO8094210.1 AAA family ATPase [Candidatus Brocadiales bacterium]